jgi:hypothetical protein
MSQECPPLSHLLPHVLPGDIRGGRTPYGRQCWQQSWCTVCVYHGCPLAMRKSHPSCGFEIPWSAADLRVEIQYGAPDRYRDLKVARESEVRCAILGSLVEIERVVVKALAGTSPNRLFWGNLTAEEFLTVLDDVTTWSPTHFEPVSAWSAAEALTDDEEQEGYGQHRRQCGSLATPIQNGQRSLREVTQPTVCGAVGCSCALRGLPQRRIRPSIRRHITTAPSRTAPPSGSRRPGMAR